MVLLVHRGLRVYRESKELLVFRDLTAFKELPVLKVHKEP